ncbi:leucine-rich repeat domain-containing protein, partial [Streptomyces sp. SID8455]|nr:leucine-rich repeat domain-containing protein [Streptomyces sp. SID8455]
MYEAEHLQAFGGLPAVDFQSKDDPADRPAADD